MAEEEWDFYERPPLSKATLLDTDAQLPRLFSHEAQQALNLTWYRPLRAERIDRLAKTVILSNGERLSYNVLLIATGGERVYRTSRGRRIPRFIPCVTGRMRSV